MLNKKTKIRYQVYDYEIVMPQSQQIQTLTVNRLTAEPEDKDTPLMKIILPKETGYFKGLKYTEQSTLLGYANQKWRKLKSIQFDQTAEQILGVDEINTINKLSGDDLMIKRVVLESFA